MACLTLSLKKKSSDLGFERNLFDFPYQRLSLVRAHMRAHTHLFWVNFSVFIHYLTIQHRCDVTQVKSHRTEQRHGNLLLHLERNCRDRHPLSYLYCNSAKAPDESNLRKKGLILAQSLRMQSIMVARTRGGAERQERDAGAQLTSIFNSVQPREWCNPHLGCLPDQINQI